MRVHFPDTKLLTSSLRVTSSEPSANLAWGAMAGVVFESDRVNVVERGVFARMDAFVHLCRAVVMTADDDANALSVYGTVLRNRQQK